jgi:hypothetical protein
LRAAYNIALNTGHHVDIVILGGLNSLLGHERMDRAGRGYCLWCRDKLLVCISVLGFLLVFCEISARQRRPDWCYACQLRCLRPLGRHGSELRRPLMRWGRSWSWHEWTRSGRDDRSCKSCSTVAKHCDEREYIMRYGRNEPLLLNAGEGKRRILV